MILGLLVFIVIAYILIKVLAISLYWIVIIILIALLIGALRKIL